MAANEATEYQGRIDEEYLLAQINGFRTQKRHMDHKKDISDYDKLYEGDFGALFPGEVGLDKIPLVENKLKNATHDLARLSSEAKGMPVFMKEGDSTKDVTASVVRAGIADTIWRMGNGPAVEQKLYLDLISTGMAAVSVFENDSSSYPIFMRLNPRYCYPDVMNGELQSLVYVETVKTRQAAQLFPNLGLKDDPRNSDTVLITTYYDDMEAVQCVSNTKKGGTEATNVTVVSRWIHELGVIPVAFQLLDSADDSFHGLFNQLGGPLMVKNKIIRLEADYLESLVHAPFEAKNIINADDEPGPMTIYQHDQNAEQSFMRRVAPAASSGSVFGLLNYMDAQESAEGIQPPARVGVVSQSIASGSFVASTQGTLSSVVKELQGCMARLRTCLGTVAFKVDAQWLNVEKPLFKNVGTKTTYTPKDDMGTWMNHTIEYGAAAGLNRAEADQRVLMHLGSKLISKRTAQQQLDYIDDITDEQRQIDQEQLSEVFFQRFSADPNTPVPVLAKAIMLMGKGKSLVDVVTAIEADLQAAAQAQQQAAAGQGSQGGQLPAGGPPGVGEPGGPGPGPGTGPIDAGVQIQAPPIEQLVNRNPVR